VPFWSDPAVRNSLSPIWIFLIQKKELINKLYNHMFLLPPSFSSTHKSTSFGNCLLYHQHQQFPDLHFVTIKVQCKIHRDLFIMTLESGKEFEPTNISEPLGHLRISFKEFSTLGF
jgi:hypothetical protein